MAKFAVTLFALGHAVQGRAVESVTPVQKVVELMQNMLQKGQEEKKGEQVQFASYTQFCDDTSVEKQRDISEANDRIEVLKADIEKCVAIAEKMTKQIAEHDGDIGAWTGDVKAASVVRELEKADYTALHRDYSESIDALGRAISVVKRQAKDRPQAALVQVSALKKLRLVPMSVGQALDTFLQQQEPVAAPDAAGFESQSHGVVDMLEKLEDQFTQELRDLENSEANAKHAYDMLMQDMKAQIGQATKDRASDAEEKATQLQSKADHEGDMKERTATRNADKVYLADLQATCEKKTSDFESRQQLRQEELEAISKAIEIISSDDVKGAGEEHLPALVQEGASALVSLRSGLQNFNQARVAEYLERRGQQLDSKMLSALSLRVSNDPFTKVKKMIKDMIVRLMAEANEESDHKGWCDAELSTNEQTRREKTTAVESLSAEVDRLEASIAKLTEDIAELNQGIADLDEAMTKQTAFRTDEKAKNEKTIADAKAAQAAVQQAMVVLKEFYAKAGEATALVQQPYRDSDRPASPEIFDKPYTGMQAENGGVVGMLEVIESDFARLEADTSASEATAQREYVAFMSDSKADKAAKSSDVEQRTVKKQDENQELTVRSEDLRGTQVELDASLAYFDKLKPSCVDNGVSYDDRVARREEEIKSLHSALKILNGEEM